MLPTTTPNLYFHKALIALVSFQVKPNARKSSRGRMVFRSVSIDFNQAFLLVLRTNRILRQRQISRSQHIRCNYRIQKYSKNNLFVNSLFFLHSNLASRATFVRRCRLTWVLIFLSACTFLVWLVSQKIIHLQTNPKNVNLDFNFNATLPFPAVTICNQSPYRYVISMGIISARRTLYLTNPLWQNPLTKTPLRQPTDKKSRAV